MAMQKILLVGDSRICPQVAYVMDWRDFEQVEKLTDTERYFEYKIIVCAFKKKSKRLVKVKDKNLNVIYLDDICRELDIYDRTHNTEAIPAEPWSFWRRVKARIKDGKVGVSIVRYLKRNIVFRKQWLINRLPLETLKLSELFLKVLYSKPTNITCDALQRAAFVDVSGKVYGCRGHWSVVPFGNVLNQDLADIYHSVRARVVKLSAINRSYCFCDLAYCAVRQALPPTAKEHNQQMPERVEIAIDPTCNLHCSSCRRTHFSASALEQQRIDLLADKILNSNWATQVPYVRMAGNGEIFASTTYRRMLSQWPGRQQMWLLSNGTLFNEDSWQLVKDKFHDLEVSISVDAVTAETYRKLRGGDFKQLTGNLIRLSNLRQQGKIRFLQLNFVVQLDNYREMVEFVRWGKSLCADRVLFTKLNDCHTWPRRVYRKKSLLRRNGQLRRELDNVLRDPIFCDPIVDLIAFRPYLTNFEQRFPQHSTPKPIYEW